MRWQRRMLLSKAKSGSPNPEIVLPGNIFAYDDSPIYARTDGYLSHWYFDIGAHVRKGQLLAVISSLKSISNCSGPCRSGYCGGERRLRQEHGKAL